MNGDEEKKKKHSQASPIVVDSPYGQGVLSLRSAQVLVTGGAGFIGRWLVDALSFYGAEVTVVDDLSTSGDFGKLSSLKNVHTFRESVMNPHFLGRNPRKFDFVFHLAGVVGMRLAHRQARRAHFVAEQGTRNVIRATGTARLIAFSSSSVYAFSPAIAMSEDAPIVSEELAKYDAGPIGYASGKAALERAVHAVSEEGRECLILRPFNVVGPGQSRLYGMVLPEFVYAALRGKPLQVYDDGLQSRSFACVQTFIQHLIKLVTSPDAYAPKQNVFNLGNPTESSILSLAHAVLTETRSQSEIEFVPYASVFPNRIDVRQRKPSISRAESIIGKTHWPSVTEVVRSVIHHPQSHSDIIDETGRSLLSTQGPIQSPSLV